MLRSTSALPQLGNPVLLLSPSLASDSLLGPSPSLDDVPMDNCLTFLLCTGLSGGRRFVSILKSIGFMFRSFRSDLVVIF